MSAVKSGVVFVTAMGLGAIFATVGCEMPRDKPRLEDGPLPQTPPSRSLKRVRQWHGSGVGRMESTLWEEDGKLVAPNDRVADLRNAIETGLHEHLTKKQMAKLNDGRRFERPATYVHASVVSLTPDIAIASVADMPVDSTKGPFDDWPGAQHLHSDPKKRFGAEYINCYRGNLTVSAGPIVPFSKEMYAISGERDVPIQRIQFAGDEATIILHKAVITMTHDGAAVRVKVEYR